MLTHEDRRAGGWRGRNWQLNESAANKIYHWYRKEKNETSVASVNYELFGSADAYRRRMFEFP
jgi:hypothetical protein